MVYHTINNQLCITLNKQLLCSPLFIAMFGNFQLERKTQLSQASAKNLLKLLKLENHVELPWGINLQAYLINM